MTAACAQLKDAQHMIYLDNAATTYPKPPHLLAQMAALYGRIGASPGRGSHDMAALAEEYIRQARVKLAAFFGAPDPARVIFTANATDSLNLAIQGLVQPGDHVIATRLEHNSVLRPLYHLQREKQITFTLVPFDGHGVVDPQAIAAAFLPRTRLVIVNHISNVLGTVQPVEEVGEICAAHGIDFLVDGSQSAGQIAVDMGAIKASAVAFTGHKSLYGPSGIGGLVLHPDLYIRPTRFGGTGIDSRDRMHTDYFPYRLEAGTPNLLGIIGLSLSLDYLLSHGIEQQHSRQMALMERLASGLLEINGIKRYSPGGASRNSAMLTVNIDGMASQDVAAILDGDFDIAVRAGLHCAPLVHEDLGTSERGAVRFSIGQFNTEAEINRTIAAMAMIAKQHS